MEFLPEESPYLPQPGTEYPHEFLTQSEREYPRESHPQPGREYPPESDREYPRESDPQPGREYPLDEEVFPTVMAYQPISAMVMGGDDEAGEILMFSTQTLLLKGSVSKYIVLFLLSPCSFPMAQRR